MHCKAHADLTLQRREQQAHLREAVVLKKHWAAGASCQAVGVVVDGRPHVGGENLLVGLHGMPVCLNLVGASSQAKGKATARVQVHGMNGMFDVVTEVQERISR